MIHHIAIASPNLKEMSDFYRNLPGLQWREDKLNEQGELRSVWFETSDKSLLMLENFPYSKAPEALVFKMNSSFELTNKISITKRTDYTVYFLDPDGNQLGYSSHPEKLSLK